MQKNDGVNGGLDVLVLSLVQIPSRPLAPLPVQPVIAQSACLRACMPQLLFLTGLVLLEGLQDVHHTSIGSSLRKSVDTFPECEQGNEALGPLLGVLCPSKN